MFRVTVVSGHRTQVTWQGCLGVCSLMVDEFPQAGVFIAGCSQTDKPNVWHQLQQQLPDIRAQQEFMEDEGSEGGGGFLMCGDLDSTSDDGW